MYVEVPLRPDYACSMTCKGIVAADVGPFTTLLCNYFQNNQEQVAHQHQNGYKAHQKSLLRPELERS